jgi:uncharacterized membrane protein HdeD (DUF308 family)
MEIAARILGDQVGSTAPLFLAFLAVHVIAGLTAIITGAIAALTRKGSRRHVRVGRWFYWAITVVFLTAAALTILRWRQDYHLLLIGVVAFIAATIGFLHRRRHRPGDTGHILGMGIGYVAMLTAFYVDNGPHLPLWDRLPPLTFWFLPGVIGTPIITRAIVARRRERERAGGGRTTERKGRRRWMAGARSRT